MQCHARYIFPVRILSIAFLNKLTSFLYQGADAEVLCFSDSQEPVTVHLLHLRSTNVDRAVCLCLFFNKINNQPLGFSDVEQ